MPDFTPIFQAAGAQYSVDPTILRAIAMKESSMNPAAVNPASGASGLMGFTPATAKSYGINPLDPEQAIPTAARMFAENLKRFNGNVEDAVAAHFAGPNQKLWGPKTSQYVDQVSGIFGQMKNGSLAAPESAGGADPILDMAKSIQAGGAPSGGQQAAAPAAASDPILSMAQNIASGKSPAPAASVSGAAAVPPAAGQSNDAGLAQDLAAGGASPNTLTELAQIARGGAHGVGSFFNNVANLVEKGVASGLNAIPGVRNTGLARAATNAANSDVAMQSSADQRFSQSASPGEKAAAFVAPMAIPLGDLAVPGKAIGAGVKMIPGMGGAIGRAVGTGLGNAATGAVVSGAAPIDPNQPYWPQVARNAEVGAGIGAALPAAISAGKAVGSNIWNALRPVVAPAQYVGRGLANALGEQAPEVASNIRSAPEFVRGSMPTTAQAGANPVLVATEKAAANANPDLRNALAQRAIANNDARWQALTGVAQTPEAQQAAVAARDAAAAPLYQQAHQATANVGPAFMRYAQIPEMQEAMQRANQLASLDAAVDRGIAPVWPTPTSKTINGAALDYTSRALGDMIDEAQRAGAKSKAGALAALRGKVDGWTQTYIPGVQQARAAYAAGSVPVNTMEVGQQIANGLGTRAMNPGGAPEIQMMPFRSALTKAMGSGDAAKYGIDADALNSLQGIGQDLQRATISNSLRSPGSDTAYNLAAQGWLARQLYGPTFGGSSGIGKGIAAGGALLTGHPIAAAAILGGAKKIGQMAGTPLQAELSNFLLNPDALLPYLDARAAGPVNGTQQALAAALRRQVIPAVVGGVTRRSLVNSQ